ncbi:MAG: TolC family protein [Planctomycetaceae bacterium]
MANELVQNGLNVARDTRVAYADFMLAQERYEFAREMVQLRTGLADLAQKRLNAGDIGELEVITVRVDADRSRTDAAGFLHAVDFAEANLKNMMGIASLNIKLIPQDANLPAVVSVDVDSMIQEAIAIRPDVKAARISRQAALKRIELAKKSFLRIDAVADGNHGGAGPSNVGPGLRFEIPIFNRNQGLIIRSEWSLDQANHNYYAIRDQVITDVRTAHANLLQAQESLVVLRTDVLPALEESVQLAESSYRDGGDTYLFVLQSLSQFLDARVQEIQFEAALRKAIAELERGVGKKIFSEAVTISDAPPSTDLIKTNPENDVEQVADSTLQLSDYETDLSDFHFESLEETVFTNQNSLPPVIERPEN